MNGFLLSKHSTGTRSIKVRSAAGAASYLFKLNDCKLLSYA